jgi:hypothetical protein
MWDGYGGVPVTSRAAEAELERQRARRRQEARRAEAEVPREEASTEPGASTGPAPALDAPPARAGWLPTGAVPSERADAPDRALLGLARAERPSGGLARSGGDAPDPLQGAVG